MHIVETVRNNIQRLKEKNGFSNLSLAAAADISTNNVNNLLRGEHSPTIASLEKLAKAFNVPISALFEEQGEKHEESKKDIPAQNCR